MENTYADPSPAGYAALAFVLWLFSMLEAGWYSTGDGLITAIAFALAGGAVVFVGLLEFLRGETFQTVLFLLLGAGWFSYAVGHAFFAAKITHAMTGWYMALWTVFLFFMWLASFHLKRLWTQLLLLGLWLTAGCLAVGAWGVGFLTVIGGYVGLITALIFLYLASAGIIEKTKTVRNAE
ncbi:MAG: transcriptional regulator [Acidobacteria bacterium]|nr:transcriptional regulator [Acidobacteriota bacterium]